jgi:hypothetical protein
MVYLEPSDFTDAQKLEVLAAQTNLAPAAFSEAFEPVARP